MAKPVRFVLLATAFVAIALSLSPLPASARVLLKPANGETSPMFARSIAANVTVVGQFAVTDLTLVFINATSSSTEADFTYALPSGAVATYFAYWAEDEKVVARVVEKKQAAEIYSNLTTESHDPALVEMTGKNTFRARVSPILAFKDLKIQLRFVQLLPSDKSGFTYTLPLADDCRQDDELESIDVNIAAKPGDDISAVTDNYGLPVTHTGGEYALKLSTVNYRPQKDLNVRFARKPGKLHSSLYAAPASGADGFFALALTPDHSLSRPIVQIRGIHTYEITPSRLPNVKAGESVLVCGRYKGSGSADVTLRGTSSVGLASYSTRVCFRSNSEPENLASKLWAASRIRQLSAERGKRASIVDLSMRFTIPSKFTSWLAVPKAEMLRYKREAHWQELNRLSERLAELIASGEESSTEGCKVAQQFEALCRAIGSTVDVEISNLLYTAASNLAAEISALEALSEGATPESSAMRNRLAAICKRITSDDYPRPDPEDLIRANKGNAIYTVSGHLLDLIERGHGDTPEAQALRLRLTRLDGEQNTGYARYDRHALNSRAQELRYELMQAKYGLEPNPAQARDLELRLQRLQAAGASVQDLTKLKDAALRSTAGELAEELTSRIASGASDAKASRLWKRYHELEKEPGIHVSDRLRTSARERMRSLAYDLVEQMHTAKPGPANVKLLKAQMARLQPFAGRTARSVLTEQNDSWDLEWIPDQLSNAMITGKDDTKSVKSLYARFVGICKRTGKDAIDVLRENVRDRLPRLEGELAYASSAPNPDPVKVQRLQAMLSRGRQIAGESISADYMAQRTKYYMRDCAREQADALDMRLSAELSKNKPNRATLAKLREQIRPANTEMLNEEYAKDYDKMLDYGMGIVDVRDEIRAAAERRDTARLADLKKKESELRAEFSNRHWEVTVKWGDPLISVQAPADAKQVVALMPDGEVKVLSYNAANGRWEARFDVPTCVTEGEYQIEVIVVLPDNTRKTLTLTYRLDITPPRGKPTVALTPDRMLRIVAEVDGDTARAVAILPWNERIELRHTGEHNRFGAQTAVPIEYRNRAYTVAIILTDQAHNRASIPVHVGGQQ